MELDAQTPASRELMDAPNGADSRPWAVRARLLRKLLESFRPRPADAGKDAGVLIIGEPATIAAIRGCRARAGSERGAQRFSTSGAIAPDACNR